MKATRGWEGTGGLQELGTPMQQKLDFCFVVFVSVALGMEPRFSHTLGKCVPLSYTPSHKSNFNPDCCSVPTPA
jgi:hypothetical protein